MVYSHENFDITEIDEESKEMTALFANVFAYYVIEKMELRINEKEGNSWKQKLDSKNEKFVSKMLEYFSNILLKDFIPIIEMIINIDDREIYHILKDTLNDYNKDYHINYQRKKRYEIL